MSRMGAMQPCSDCRRHVRLGALICPFCAVALALVGCHRAPTTTEPTRDASVSQVAVYGGPPIDLAQQLQQELLATLGDAGSPTEPIRDAGPDPVRIELSVTGPTESGDERIVAGMRAGFATCARNAVLADASIASSPTLAVTIAANGEVTSTLLTDTKGLSEIEVDCLLRKAKRASFDAGPPRTLRVVIKQSLAK
jgi:hypothetical protein